MDELISQCVVVIDDRAEMKQPAATIQRNRVLLDIITKRPFNTFDIFIDVLAKDENNNPEIQDLVRKVQESKKQSIVYSHDQPYRAVAGELNLNIYIYLYHRLIVNIRACRNYIHTMLGCHMIKIITTTVYDRRHETLKCYGVVILIGTTDLFNVLYFSPFTDYRKPHGLVKIKTNGLF